MRVWLAIALLLAQISLPTASACDCGLPGPACAYVAHAKVVFIGTVTFTDHDPALGLRQRTFVRFTVEQAFKGLPSGVHDVWIDPGSFTSCYAEYPVGTRLLVFGYGGMQILSDTAMVSTLPGELKPKPLPVGMSPTTIVYSAPECSGTREMDNRDSGMNADLIYLRQFKAGTAAPEIRGRVTEDANFGIFGFDIPGLRGVKITATGNGITRTAVTDADGYYTMPAAAGRSYRVEPSLPGDRSTWRARDIEVPSAGCAAAEFDMIGSGSIEGALTDRAGLPAQKVRVELLRLDGQGKPIYYAEKKATTGAMGEFSFSGLPRGDFQIGVNLFEAPDPETPYVPTRWANNGVSSVHLAPGERKVISAFRLPQPSAVRLIEAEVKWSDGRPAAGVDVWGDVGDRTAAHAVTDAQGVAQFEALEGIRYTVEAKIWVGEGVQRQVARSGALEVLPTGRPVHLNFVLNKRTESFR